jgi:hypothetical protein
MDRVTNRSTLRAFQRVGLNLGLVAANYDPEPDVVVIDGGPGDDPHYADRFYLAAEVLSDMTARRLRASARSTSAIQAVAAFSSSNRAGTMCASICVSTQTGR